MRGLFAAVLLLLISLDAQAQSVLGNSNTIEHLSQTHVLSGLNKQANEAHKKGQFEEEINYRLQFTHEAWAAFARNPKSLNDEYDRYNIIFFNDLPLGLLLEGSHRYSEAEATLRHNQSQLAAERIAGNDIKAQNELHLAHLLLNENKDQEGNAICSHWEKRMKHLPGRQDSDHVYGIPRAPIYDTAEVEVARWDLACGKPEEGLKLIAEQISAHPKMLASFTVLSEYYYAQGDFQKARKAEVDGMLAVTGH